MESDDADDFWSSLFHRRRNNMEGGQRGGSSEFRRANIVYFLSRNGTVEHPHLIRVHHLNSNGVHLRDVKRWLTELRGKDMSDSFAWSYKRRYKSGYVWQDLKDDDLITPISDNEYVLKGSLLRFHSLNGLSTDENSKKETEKAVAEHQVIPNPKSEPETLRIKQDDIVSPKLQQPELDGGDSPIKSDNTDRRMAVVMINDPSTKKQEEKDQQRFRRSYSSRASHVLRNILRCGAADANDSVLMPISGGSGHHRRRSTGGVPRQQQHRQQGCETDNNNNSRKSQRSTSKSRGSSASCKPLMAPNCSQCGRPFDPEKLHSHMQSCRGLKGSRGKGRISTDRVPLRRDSRSEDDFSRDSISGYLT